MNCESLRAFEDPWGNARTILLKKSPEKTNRPDGYPADPYGLT